MNKIIFIYLPLVLITAESSLRGKCVKLDRSGRQIWFCCKNEEDVNGTCIKCLDGFESFDGKPCIACLKGFFGKECINRWNCTKTERCNHVRGCINIQEDVTADTAGITESTTFSSNTSTFGDYNENLITSHVFSTVKLHSLGTKDVTIITSIRRLTSTTPKHEANDLGLDNREIIIYSISAGSFAVLILTCSVCQRRYKRIYRNFKSYQTGNRQRINITQNLQQEVPLEDIEGLYEEINESNMIDNMVNLKENNESVTDSNDSYVQPDSNNYLTPYQPADDDTKTNTSKDSNSESSASTNQPINDHESTSSKSDVIGERSSYLNPYQPIIHSVDIHEYSSTHKIDDSDSSESDTQTMEPGYLNPYQPIVPDNDLHEYKSVLKCSDGLDSTISNACTNNTGDEFPAPKQGMRSDTDTDEFKYISNSKTTDIVSNILDTITDDSVEKFQVENDESYVQME